MSNNKDKSKKPKQAMKRYLKTYDSTSRLDPANPVEMKALSYIEGCVQHIIFVMPDEVDAALEEMD